MQEKFLTAATVGLDSLNIPPARCLGEPRAQLSEYRVGYNIRLNIVGIYNHNKLVRS